MECSTYDFRRPRAEETLILYRMATSIHQNTDMKIYLFPPLAERADFAMVEEWFHGGTLRIEGEAERLSKFPPTCPSWSQVKAIRAPLWKQKYLTSRAMFLTDTPKNAAAVIVPEAGPAPNVVGRQTGLPGPAHPRQSH